MSVDGKTVVGGVRNPGGYIVSTAIRVLTGTDRTRAPNKRQREALLSAGYTRETRAGPRPGMELVTWRTPDGKALRSSTRATNIGRSLIKSAAAPATPPLNPAPPKMTGEELFEELLRKRDYRPPDRLPRSGGVFDDLIRRPRAPAPTPDAPEPAPRPSKLPRVARVLGRVGGIIGGILYPSETASDDVLYPPGTAIPAPQPDRPRGPPRRPVLTREPRDLPKLPGPSTGTVADRLPQPRVPGDAVALPFPVVLPTRDPSPSPAKRPRPTSVPAPTVAPVGLPSPLSFPIPLPTPRAAVAPRPILSPLVSAMPGRIRDTLTQPLPSPLTLTQTAPVGSPPSDRCSCPPKQKRKPSKPRTVCYSGSYRERSRGIDKQPRRKIPCQ